MLFLTQNWQKFHANFLQIVFLAKLVFNFHSGISINTTLCLWIWLHLMENIKKTTEIPVFLCFLTTLYKIWPRFCPTDHTHFTFLVDFQWNTLGDSITVNNLCCNPAVPKPSSKTSKKLFLGSNLHKKEVIMGHALNEKQMRNWETIFFGRNN